MAIKGLLRRIFGKVFRERTLAMIYLDLLRLKARWRGRLKKKRPLSPRLHLGCGRRLVEGWLNVDVRGSDFDVDLAAGRLPWKDESFESVVSQHVIDDLEIERELIPLLKEIKRVLKQGGELWLSTQDMTKICRSYVEDGGAKLIADRKTRIPDFDMKGYPDSQFMNELFYDSGWNMNEFDLPLLDHVLHKAGFDQCRRVDERDFLERFPDFPPRRDDYPSLYVRVIKTEEGARRG